MAIIGSIIGLTELGELAFGSAEAAEVAMGATEASTAATESVGISSMLPELTTGQKIVGGIAAVDVTSQVVRHGTLSPTQITSGVLDDVKGLATTSGEVVGEVAGAGAKGFISNMSTTEMVLFAGIGWYLLNG